jgi:hypothetical protein
MKTGRRYPFFVTIDATFGRARELHESDVVYLKEKIYQVLRTFIEDDRPILIRIETNENPNFTGDKT